MRNLRGNLSKYKIVTNSIFPCTPLTSIGEIKSDRKICPSNEPSSFLWMTQNKIPTEAVFRRVLFFLFYFLVHTLSIPRTCIENNSTKELASDMFQSFYIDIEISPHQPMALTERIRQSGGNFPKSGVMNVFSTSPVCSVIVSRNSYKCPQNAKFSKCSSHFQSSLFSQSVVIPVMNSSVTLPDAHEIVAYSFSSDPVKVRIVLTIRTCEKQDIVKIRASDGCTLRGNELFRSKVSGNGYFHSFSLHPNIALSLNENWDSDVRIDMYNSLDDICVRDTPTKTHLMGRDVLVCLDSGRFCSGSWQGIYVCCFGNGGNSSFISSYLLGKEVRIFKKMTIRVRAPRRGLYPLIDLNKDFLNDISRVKVGMIHFQILHTSASLGLGRKGNCRDMKVDLNNVVKENVSYYRHTCEGSDDMPAHIKTSFFGPHLTVPIRDGKMVLGKDQDLLFGEYRDSTRNRNIIVIIEGL